jgi:hypothetical protein
MKRFSGMAQDDEATRRRPTVGALAAVIAPVWRVNLDVRDHQPGWPVLVATTARSGFEVLPEVPGIC